MTPNLDARPFYPRQLSLDTLTVGGNWGTLTVDRLTGRVLDLDESDRDESEAAEVGYRDIVKVDLREFYETYGKDDPSEHLDILDVGFWFTDGAGGVGYETPELDWRETIRTSGVVGDRGAPVVIQLGAN